MSDSTTQDPDEPATGPASAAEIAADGESAPRPTDSALAAPAEQAAPAEHPVPAEQPMTAEQPTPAEQAPAEQATPAEQAPAEQPVPGAPGLDEPPTRGRPAPRPETYVAEIWIDPDWYDVQSSPDAMPSVGLPQTVKLGPSNLIGRESRSRNIVPEIDCGIDTGCSRRQSMLTTDGTRWYVEDLGSANGTFVGPAGGPLPTEPIKGRTELATDDRIYVGAWSRIVVRKASREEIEALG